MAMQNSRQSNKFMVSEINKKMEYCHTWLDVLDKHIRKIQPETVNTTDLFQLYDRVGQLERALVSALSTNV